MINYSKILIILFFFANVSSLHSQSSFLKEIDKELEIGKIPKSFYSVKPSKLSQKDLAFYYKLMAKYNDIYNYEDKALNYFIKSKKQYLKCKDPDNAMDLNLDIAFLLSANFKDLTLPQKYIDEYMEYAFKTKNNSKVVKGYVEIATLYGDDVTKSLTYFRKALQLNKKVKDTLQQSRIYNNMSVVFNEFANMPDSGLYYLKKDLIILNKYKDSSNICMNLLNQAASHYHMKDYAKSIELLKLAKKNKSLDFRKNSYARINYLLYFNYKTIHNFPEALKYLEESMAYKDSINEDKIKVAITDTDTKYRAQEKELENLILKNKLQVNNTITYTIIGLFIVFVIIGLLFYKNFMNKKKINEQKGLIEIQKLQNNLKEQELNQIDVMLESQETERQRIANELHDNLGSMLATLKLNFENLRQKKQELATEESNLYDKTDALIEEAYQEIRNISHLKNLGVIGNEGLVIAVKKMAEKMSVIKKLKINVIPYGLSERLENTLEVTVYRIVQELATNIIKHSKATDVNIYLTQHSNQNLNIIIEDNGVGFNPKDKAKSEGIGLKNIERKVEQMNGTFTIDSIISKGTTIIIDIPL